MIKLKFQASVGNFSASIDYVPNGVKVIRIADIRDETIPLAHSHVSLLQSQLFERLFISIAKAIVPN